MEFDGGVLRRYETQGTRLNETIDGEVYSGQRYEFLFFGLRDGEFTLNSQPLDVEVKTWGAQSGSDTSQQQTPSLTLHIRNPPGVPVKTVFVSSNRFEAVQTWEPDGATFKVGDAITRVIKREGDDVSAMIFSPWTGSEIPGIGVYEKEPVVSDSFNRGELVGSRTERITYVMEQAGTYSIPGIDFYWWDLKNENLGTITLPGLEMKVEGESSAVEATPAVTQRSSIYLYVIIGFFLTMMSIAYMKRTSIISVFRTWRYKRQHSEKAYFKRIGKAAEAKDKKAFIRAAMQWLDILAGIEKPARMDLFLERYGGENSTDPVSRFYINTGSWSPESLHEELIRARRKYLKRRKQVSAAEAVLPPVGLGRSYE
jgi:hypothetical protein